jgi:hypothetical protein
MDPRYGSAQERSIVGKTMLDELSTEAISRLLIDPARHA